MFIGWYDSDPTLAIGLKVENAVARYVERFGFRPTVCLTSGVDATLLAGRTDLQVRAVSYIGRHTFYIGIEEAMKPLDPIRLTTPQPPTLHPPMKVPVAERELDDPIEAMAALGHAIARMRGRS